MPLAQKMCHTEIFQVPRKCFLDTVTKHFYFLTARILFLVQVSFSCSTKEFLVARKKSLSKIKKATVYQDTFSSRQRPFLWKCFVPRSAKNFVHKYCLLSSSLLFDSKLGRASFGSPASAAFNVGQCSEN